MVPRFVPISQAPPEVQQEVQQKRLRRLTPTARPQADETNLDLARTIGSTRTAAATTNLGLGLAGPTGAGEIPAFPALTGGLGLLSGALGGASLGLFPQSEPATALGSLGAASGIASGLGTLFPEEAALAASALGVAPSTLGNALGGIGLGANIGLGALNLSEGRIGQGVGELAGTGLGFGIGAALAPATSGLSFLLGGLGGGTGGLLGGLFDSGPSQDWLSFGQRLGTNVSATQSTFIPTLLQSLETAKTPAEAQAAVQTFKDQVGSFAGGFGASGTPWSIIGIPGATGTAHEGGLTFNPNAITRGVNAYLQALQQWFANPVGPRPTFSPIFDPNDWGEGQTPSGYTKALMDFQASRQARAQSGAQSLAPQPPVPQFPPLRVSLGPSPETQTVTGLSGILPGQVGQSVEATGPTSIEAKGGAGAPGTPGFSPGGALQSGEGFMFEGGPETPPFEPSVRRQPPSLLSSLQRSQSSFSQVPQLPQPLQLPNLSPPSPPSLLSQPFKPLFPKPLSQQSPQLRFQQMRIPQ